MIRAIDNKPLDLSDEEFEYYIQIAKEFGAKVFQDTFVVEEDESSANYGYIILVKPPMSATLPLGVVFFLFNCMLNQRVREFEKVIRNNNGSK